jgi:adenylyltransferase/sulfurtransferase
MSFRAVRLRRDPSCPACGTRSLGGLIDYDQFCGLRNEAPAGFADITPQELARRLQRGDDFDLIDVREQWEWDASRIAGARLIPLGELEHAAGQLDRAREVIVHCKSGGRSAKAARLLVERGFARVSNLAGGITRWQNDLGSG